MRKCALLFLLLLFLLTAKAEDTRSKERVYAAPFEKVWQVCVQAASERWKVTHADEAHGDLTFHQGVSFKTNTWGMNVRVTIVRVDQNRTKVALEPKKIIPTEISWARSDIAKKFFAALDKELTLATSEIDTTAPACSSANK